MKFKSAIAGVALAAMAVSSPALAGWKLVAAGEEHKLAKSDMRVTPEGNWNRQTKRPIKRGEIWTIDGTSLNELYFVGGLEAGETMLKDRDKKNNPLPKLPANMLLTDIPEFYESTTRTVLGTSLFEIENVEPATFLGQSAVKFEFNYGVQGDALVRKGMAMGTLVDGKLYLASYVAPSLHYFDRDLERVEGLMGRITL